MMMLALSRSPAGKMRGRSKSESTLRHPIRQTIDINIYLYLYICEKNLLIVSDSLGNMYQFCNNDRDSKRSPLLECGVAPRAVVANSSYDLIKACRGGGDSRASGHDEAVVLCAGRVTGLIFLGKEAGLAM
jgi:hypothetical protein